MRNRNPITEPRWFQVMLIAITICFLAGLIFLPVMIVFAEAFKNGIDLFFAAITNEDAVFSIKLTIFVSLISVFANLVFGVIASWAIAKFEFSGKYLLITLIDLPFSISPVVAGLIYIMLYGAQSRLGMWLVNHEINIVFAIPGIILVTTFTTFPFVARELIPLMQEQGTEPEEAAILLGASGWQTFFRVTLPNIKIGLLYGVLLCNARAMGEFGAVSVISGHISGMTNTIPLTVEIFYNNYQFQAAFALASTLTVLALVTLVLKFILDFMGNKANDREAI